MTRMNGRRILLGGAAAGLAVMIGEMLLEFVAGARMEAWLAGFGLDQPGEAAMVAYLFASLAFGVTAVWLYAAVTPRLGAGPGTAFRIGLAGWVLACVVPNVVTVAIGVIPVGLFLITVPWSAVELVAATLVGSWVYREGTATNPAGAAAASTAARI